MDIWHKLGRIFRLSNIGVLCFFVLNILLIGLLFYPLSVTPEGAILLIGLYLFAVLISLSPLGEWVLSKFAGAQEIKRKDIKIRLIPLLEVVLSKAAVMTPDIKDSIHLMIVSDDAPNAFTIGRRTICVTDGLLSLSDDEIMAVFAHELGHIAYKHSVLDLLIGGSNLFITFFLLIIKLICWTITAIMACVAAFSNKLARGVITVGIASIPSVLIWAWTKFCLLFLMWSHRRMEFDADEYASRLGYGAVLAYVLDTRLADPKRLGLFKALWSSHPNNDDRIAHLQDVGVDYYRYC